GYTDMLAQRGGKKLDDRRGTARTAPTAKPAGEPKGQPKQPARKLSYKQKFALETLPKRMEAALASIGAVERQLADPDFYRRDPDAFAAATEAHDKARAELAAMEDEWLELE